MKIDVPPKPEEKTTKKSIEKNDGFEKIKVNFSIWVDVYLQDIFEGKSISEERIHSFDDPVMDRIKKMTGGNDYEITDKMRELSLVFLEKLKFFCKQLIFDKKYDKDKTEKFYGNLRKVHFSSSKDVLENLGGDFLQKIISCSEINEIPKLRGIIDTSGEIANDLSFSDEKVIKNLTEKIKTLPSDKKISAIKQLSSTAMMAYGNGVWAYPAFKGIVELIKKVKNSEKSPIVSFVLDFELDNIIKFSHNLDDFEESDLLVAESEEKGVEEYNKNDTARKITEEESSEFFSRNEIIPALDNIYCSGVSKDYGSIVNSQSLIPFALVKNPENINIEVSKFSSREIKGLKIFLEIAKQNINASSRKFLVEFGDILAYLKDKNLESFSEEIGATENLLFSIKKITKEKEVISQKAFETENVIVHNVENKNLEKTRELFAYVEQDFSEIFSGNFKELGNKWLNYKDEKYEDGMISILHTISSRNNILKGFFPDQVSILDSKIADFNKEVLSSEEEEEKEKILFERIALIKKIKLIEESKEGIISTKMNKKVTELNDFHQKGWKMVDEETYKATLGLKEESRKKTIEMEKLTKQVSLEKFIKFIENLLKKDERNRTKVSLINYDGLTTDKEFNPLGTDDFSHLIKILHTPEIRHYINKRLKINLENLYLKEQIHFLKFLSDSDVKIFNRLEGVLKNKEREENINFLRSFLSMSGDEAMGSKLIVLGEKLPEDVAKLVFAKYGEIIEVADRAEDEIKNIFGNKDVPGKVLISTKETLLKRGAKLLSDLGDKVMDKDFKINEQVIFNELEEIKAETILLGVSYVKLYKEGISVPIEDITETEEISTKDLSKEQKAELLRVYINGRPKVTYENKEHLELLAKEFEDELNNENISVFNIRFNGDIIIFAIVDKKDKDTLYVGGLTFVDEVRNPVIAEASMNCVLEKFKNYNIRALVDSRNPILAMYQKRFGFNIVKELPREENAGELYYEIERPKDINIEEESAEKQEFEKAA